MKELMSERSWLSNRPHNAKSQSLVNAAKEAVGHCVRAAYARVAASWAGSSGW